ncbi:raffinose/stachyose/melibiose transport system substrate-binding protein [Paenibacillus sp. 1_12]|uniref:ABC transporter substrate-binding protein n=1 Tax=Paenibacillus sp. 1_12 TaxID=1566278 RepID=UPI0008E3810D|nr:sugar ABC transporter substrate-binding protein [Paenibacillus sp. 1_12]SFM22370.1 raffinose/stachyose/melibiose transport system substrate-binding protein [Paenibacillus sp. 1_12]
MRKWSLGSAMLVGVLLLSACSSQIKDSSVASSNETKAPAVQKTEEVSGEISFWSWSPEDNVWQDLIKAFNDKYPKIKVNYVRTPSADYDKKIQVAIQGGEVPDVMAFSNGPMIKNYTPILEPLAPLAEKSLGKDWEKKFKSTPMESAKKNDYRTIPTGVAVTPFLSYDVDLFNKVGAQPPKTYEELKQVVKKFEDAKLPGIVPRLGFAGGKSATVTDVFYTLVNQIAPGKLYDADAGKAKFTDPVFIQATTAFKQFYTDHVFQDGNLTTKFDPDLREMYEQKRQLPMILVGAWIMNDVANKDGLKIGDRTFGLVPMPTIAGGKSNVLINGDVPLGISKDSKHKDAAWRFVEFMATGEYQTILSKALQFLPVKEGLSMDKANLKTDIEKQSVDVILNALTKDVGGIRFLDNASIEQALFLNLQKVAAGTATPEQAMAEVQKASEAVKR